MNLYLDTSALLKRYVRERGTSEVIAIIGRARATATALITRTEMAATFAKTVRMRVLSPIVAQQKLRAFYQDWPNMAKVPIDTYTVALAGDLAWEHGLRGYDAVHLASAVIWQRWMQEPITFATFDQRLWFAAQAAGMMPFPHNIDRIAYAPES